MKQNDLIKIQLTRLNKKSKDGKRKWVEFRTPMMLVVKGEEEKGKQKKWVTVSFDESINTKELSRGELTVKVADISFPKIYEITDKEDENGEIKKKYPRVYVNAYKEFREIEREIENPFITDEPETEETEIDSEESETDSPDEKLPF